METTYSTDEVCLDEGPYLPLEPGEQPSPTSDLNCVPFLERKHLRGVRVEVGGHGIPCGSYSGYRPRRNHGHLQEPEGTPVGLAALAGRRGSPDPSCV